MNQSSSAKLFLLIVTSVGSFHASAETASDAMARGYKQGVEMSGYAEQQRAQTQLLKRQAEQQELETQRQRDEYRRQKLEREEQQQKQQSLDARLDEMQKKMADQESMQKQLADSQSREEALRKEVDALKSSQTNKPKKKKKPLEPTTVESKRN